MRRKRLFPVAALVVLLVAGATVVVRRNANARGDAITVSGNIEVTQADLSFQIAGKVVARPVEEGQRVAKGDVIARLDTQELEQQVALRKAELGVAEADRKRTEIDFARIEELFKQKVVAAREYDAGRAAYETARARVEQATQALAIARTQLDYATLVSPLSGIVLSKNLTPGEYATPITPVVTLGDLQDVWLRAYVDERDLGRVRVGQRALVTTDTSSGKRYEGRVSFLSSEAEFTPRQVQTHKERVKLVYRVKITVANPEEELKPGMPADAQILPDRSR